MKILFVHQALPSQFVHVVPALISRGHDCLGLTAASNPQQFTFPVQTYDFTTPVDDQGKIGVGWPYAEKAAMGAAAARAAAKLRDGQGYHPDVIFGHIGWGETLFLKEVWPKAKLLLYPEFFFHGRGLDVGFDPEFGPATLESDIFLRAQSAYQGQAMLYADAALVPTQWQASTFPDRLQSLIKVAHDGIDTGLIRPEPSACITLHPSGQVLKAGDEVLTFVNRNLEPYRGYHIFMRALPDVLRARPDARVVIVGGDGVSYNQPPAGSGSWKQKLLDEVGARLDLDRIFFAGFIPHDIFISLMQVSRAHVYLTYPFVLSWSLLEAMAAGAPVIASRTPPVEEVIEDGVTGRLVDFFDVPGWSAAMIDALANPAASRPLAEAARRHVVANHDIGVCLPRWIDFVERHGPAAG